MNTDDINLSQAIGALLHHHIKSGTLRMHDLASIFSSASKTAKGKANMDLFAFLYAAKREVCADPRHDFWQKYQGIAFRIWDAGSQFGTDILANEINPENSKEFIDLGLSKLKQQPHSIEYFFEALKFLSPDIGIMKHVVDALGTANEQRVKDLASDWIQREHWTNGSGASLHKVEVAYLLYQIYQMDVPERSQKRPSAEQLKSYHITVGQLNF